MGRDRFRIAALVALVICAATSVCFGEDERGTFRRYRDTVWAAELEEALDRGDDIYLDSCYVLGHVSFPDTVLGRINVFYTKFDLGISGFGTTFQSDFVFWGDTVDGAFSLIRCQLNGQKDPRSYRTTTWSGDLTQHVDKLDSALGVVFRECVFRGEASFILSEFVGNSVFRSLQFDSTVSFDDTRFGGHTSFLNTQFRHSVDFRGTKFDAGGTFHRCTFTNARIEEIDLKGVMFKNGVFDDVIFETTNPPAARDMATMSGLTTLRYNLDPTGLQSVRRDFKINGFRKQERQITYALKRRDNEINRENGDLLTYYLNLVLFDWTCDYGMSYLRPLRFALYVWVVCTLIYAFFAFWHRRGNIMVLIPNKSNAQVIEAEVQIRNYFKSKNTRQPRSRFLPPVYVMRFLKTLLGVMFFSLMSAFNIGFRDFNFGRWLRLLLTKEIDIKAVGWARTVSGLQALLSVFFFALFILCYFGRPFE